MKVTCYTPGALWRPEIKLLDDENRPSGADAVKPSVVLPTLLGNLPPRSSAQDLCHRSIVAPLFSFLDLVFVVGSRAPAHANSVVTWVPALGSDE